MRKIFKLVIIILAVSWSAYFTNIIQPGFINSIITPAVSAKNKQNIPVITLTSKESTTVTLHPEVPVAFSYTYNVGITNLYTNFTLTYQPNEDPNSASYYIKVGKSGGQFDTLTGSYGAGSFQQFNFIMGYVNAQVNSVSSESITLRIKALS